MSSSTTEKENLFADFDDEPTYEKSKLQALDPNTHNFVVEFGKGDAQIAFNLLSDDVEALLKAERAVERPVRWM